MYCPSISSSITSSHPSQASPPFYTTSTCWTVSRLHPSKCHTVSSLAPFSLPLSSSCGLWTVPQAYWPSFAPIGVSSRSVCCSGVTCWKVCHNCFVVRGGSRFVKRNSTCPTSCWLLGCGSATLSCVSPRECSFGSSHSWVASSVFPETYRSYPHPSLQHNTPDSPSHDCHLR